MMSSSASFHIVFERGITEQQVGQVVKQNVAYHLVKLISIFSRKQDPTKESSILPTVEPTFTVGPTRDPTVEPTLELEIQQKNLL